MKWIRNLNAWITHYIFENPWTVNVIVLGLSFVLLQQFVRTNGLLFSRPSVVSLKGDHGLFLTVNPAPNCQVTASAETEGNWETFHVIKVDGNKFWLRDPWDRSFSVYPESKSDSGEQFVLSANPSGPGTLEFLLTLQDDGRALISDGQGGYWSLSANLQHIVIVPEKQAGSFRATVIIPEIPLRDNLLIYFALLFLAISLVLYRSRTKGRYAIFLLLIAAFFYRLYNITVNDFLFLWDEQFHAVVAKNFLENPLKPVYYLNPLLPFDYKNWIGNHIWLHKQPLFMWQMAVFIRLLGTEAWVIRIPDLIGTLLLVWIIYRIGVLLVNYRVGYLASLFFSSSYFLFTLCTGARFTDHNDVVFLVYISLSIWAWLEYISQKNRKWQVFFLVLIGVFAGCAILTKWLVGLLVFSGWGVYLMVSGSRRTNWKYYLDMGVSLFVCILIFLPWQLFILDAYPLESRHEFALNTTHFFSVVEGHSGDNGGFFFHLNHFSELFGISLVLGVLAIGFLLYQISNPGIRIAILAWILSVFLFYGLAATKMLGFTFILAPLIFLSLGAFLAYAETVLDFIITRTWISSILFISILILLLDGTAQPYYLIQQTYYWKNHPNSCFYERGQFRQRFREFETIIPKPEQPGWVIINTPLGEVGHMMFYTDVAAVYPHLDEYNLSQLKGKGYRIGYIVIEDLEIPEYIRIDSTVRLIRFREPIFLESLDKCGM